ncbi:4-nitrobenzyl alcohol dehydrogenase-like protein [Crucibulum laeve]|uniref:pyranose dehydrogenase (acceptor) n=1 Tax=Crucibulum laeve TaxID=68775 RepID=A0A5C3MEQ8_9AGAR|nr:4-nitrobenzyl alcohol dehydrogenase-like protein [Crucibulum laeve]
MGGDNLGAWPCSLAIHPKTANRISSATAYYEPNKNKDNLVVITGAHATRIIFSSIQSGEAVAESVEYSKNGSIYTISAKKEVILAAGAFQTPQVLELSGIGDTALLAKHGVSTVIDLPSVGQNYREQFLLPFFSPTRARMTPEPGKNYTSFGCAVVHPYARGSIHIKSSDPLAPPEINLSVFDNPVDLAIMVAAVKYTRKLVATEVFKPVVAQEVVPGPSVQTDEEIEEYVRNAVGTTFHPVGTAAMLPRELGGVVDAQLKVYGTRNVRVVDASIIPVQISAHPLATVYAVAEKAADIIKLANRFHK